MTYYHMAPVLEQDIQKTLPHVLAHVVISRWQRTANPATGLADLAAPARADRDAFRTLKAVQNLHLPDGLDFEADNETIEARAQALAAKFEQKEMLGMGYKHMMEAADKEGIRSAEVFEQQLRKIANAAASDDDELLAEGIAGIKGRLKDKKWWKRQLYKFLYRAFEAVMRECGMVHRRAGLYISNEAFKRFEQRKLKARAFFEQAEAICEETGESFVLAELWEHSMANPAIRRMELMTRMRGFDEISRVHGHYGCMVTLTCPSRFHKKLSKNSADNPKFDGSTPRDGADYLQKVWTQIRANLGRAGIRIYGFRVAEPHHDATPHWHLLLFMEQAHKETFRRVVAKYGCRADREELGLHYFETDKERTAEAKRRQEAILRESGKKISLAQLKAAMKTEDEFWENYSFRFWQKSRASARVDFKDIDPAKGCAAAYLAKYVSKNIDGLTNSGESMGDDDEAEPGTSAAETAKRVGAWASQWGIRQFQQIGGVPVTLYRELRRVHVDAEDSLLCRAVHAADQGDWGKFVALLGGEDYAFVKRADLPLALYKEETEERNQYGEEKAAILRGVVELETGEYLISREKEWFLKYGGSAAAWTRVSNCTKISEADLAAVSDTITYKIPATPEEIEQTLAACEEIDDLPNWEILPDESWDLDLYGLDGEEQGKGRLKKADQDKIIAAAREAAAAARQKSLNIWKFKDYMRRLDGLRMVKPLTDDTPVIKQQRRQRYQPRPRVWTVDDVLARGQELLAKIGEELEKLD